MLYRAEIWLLDIKLHSCIEEVQQRCGIPSGHCKPSRQFKAFKKPTANLSVVGKENLLMDSGFSGIHVPFFGYLQLGYSQLYVDSISFINSL